MPTSLSSRFSLQLAVRRRGRNRALPPAARSASIAAILLMGVPSIQKIPAISVRSNHPTGRSGRPAGLCSLTGRSDSDPALGRTGRSGRTTRPAGPVEPLDRPVDRPGVGCDRSTRLARVRARLQESGVEAFPTD